MKGSLGSAELNGRKVAANTVELLDADNCRIVTFITKVIRLVRYIGFFKGSLAEKKS